MINRLTIGASITGAILVIALVALFWTPHDFTTIDISSRLAPPSWDAPLGTDHFGRDMLSLIMRGASTSLGVAAGAVIIGVGIGVPLGLMASASRRRMLDQGLMGMSNVLFAFPALVMAMLLSAGFGAGVWVAVVSIGLFNIPVFMRVSRAAALIEWQKPYILAARLVGKSEMMIVITHILPNIMAGLVVQVVIQFSLGILVESGLSYLGLGAAPPVPSWGRMLADSQTFFYLAPHLALIPGLAIMTTVMAINVLGDEIHRRFNPRHAQVA